MDKRTVIGLPGGSMSASGGFMNRSFVFFLPLTAFISPDWFCLQFLPVVVYLLSVKARSGGWADGRACTHRRADI